MKAKSSSIICIVVGFVFLSGIFFLFPSSTEVELLKISKQQGANTEVLSSPRLTVIQELATCFLAFAQPGFSSSLSRAGFTFEVLDRDTKRKEYYLVYCLEEERGELAFFGTVRKVEEDIALFWPVWGDAREILPARFRLVRLPEEPIRGFQKRRPETEKTLPLKAALPEKLRVHPVILEIVNKVSAQSLTGYVQNLQNFQTRYATTTNCEQSGTYIHDSFVLSGIPVDYVSFSFPSSNTSRNIIGTLQGTVEPSQVVIVCAHYDSFSDQRFTLAPGADDNASGAAAVMEAARVFSGYAFDFTVKFICFSAEEWGLYGSKNYALTARQQGEEIVAVVNLDMIAYTNILPEDLDIISNENSEWLADRFSTSALVYTPLDVYKIINASFVWSDHSPFWNQGYSAICGIEDFNVPNPHYHTTHDTIDTLNFDFMTDVVKASLGAVGDLAQPISSPLMPANLTSRSQVISSLFSSRKFSLLSWSPNQDLVTGYNLYRTSTSHSNYQKLNTGPITQTTYLDKNLDPGVTYYYVVTAVDNQGNESNFSREVADDSGNSPSINRRERTASTQGTWTFSGQKKGSVKTPYRK